MNSAPFCEVMAAAMASNGLKAVDVVKLTGIPKVTISYYLNGKTTPSPARRNAICEALGIEAPSLVADRWSRKHGQSETRLFRIWHGMKQRCHWPGHTAYKNYGALGVTVCDEWSHNFAAFREWALTHGYQEHLTLDRINPYGSYCPENCRWATWKEQAQNKRTPARRRQHEKQQEAEPRPHLLHHRHHPGTTL